MRAWYAKQIPGSHGLQWRIGDQGRNVKIDVLAHLAYEFSGMLDEGYELLSQQARRENQHLRLKHRRQNCIDSEHSRAIGTTRGYSLN